MSTGLLLPHGSDPPGHRNRALEMSFVDTPVVGKQAEPRPHVHVVVKAMTEDWLYHLNIRKGMLREWRRKFACLLRAQGVAAKATPRAVRGKTRPGKLNGISRPENPREVGFHG
jgi:hypothetical protein